ncbi:MAG: hypothetical protein JWO90_1466 [Solirubrobacterales bacterium]|jgi:hypothetical protein|nr:hypothetical protein [Solirubrobacterales bacterium]
MGTVIPALRVPSRAVLDEWVAALRLWSFGTYGPGTAA